MARGKVLYNISTMFVDTPDWIRELAAGLMPVGAKGSEVQPVDQLNCSFCGVQLQHVNAIHATGELSVIITHEIEVNELGTKFEVEKVKRTSKRVVSCPDCVLQIPHDKLRSHQEG